MKSIDLKSDKGEWFSFYPSPEFCIGKGAMGIVYKGWYAREPEHKVAVKMVYERSAQNKDIRKRARYEASLSISHPNIIKMLGYCQSSPDSGSIYIISEFVRGVTINQYAATLPYDVRIQVIPQMMCSVLDALICLHMMNPPVWHRDIKPSNIMVDNNSIVKLMDLGIATTDGMSLGTIDGRGFGTYAYAPPEQVVGKRSQVNGISDIYSLGVTFYELLTGVNPFAAGTDFDTLDRQISMVLPYNEAIPKHLFSVILKATEKNQQNRYSTAQEFKDDIIAALNKKNAPESNETLIVAYIVGAVVIISIFILICIL